MCDVPCIAAFCSETTECFPGMASKFFLKPFVTILEAPIITGIIIHLKLLLLFIFLFFLLLLPQTMLDD
jgi:hypothetical protein